MADRTDKEVKHANIYAALAGFQSENPEIKKTKKVDFTTKDGRSVKYSYAPLDEFVQVIRPLLAKHGLSFTHEMAGENKLQCVLYHETSSIKPRDIRIENNTGAVTLPESAFSTVEQNIIRSMPISVRRSGDMKDIGGDSTYARRYTLAEVTGCASDEDNDTSQEKLEKESAKNAVKTLFVSFKDKIQKGTREDVNKALKTIESDLALIDAKQAPKLGLTEEQYEELERVAKARLLSLDVADDVENDEK